jgi:hypothetical protein
MSEGNMPMPAPEKNPYHEGVDNACKGVHSLVVIAPPRVSTTTNAHMVFEDCARLAGIFNGRLDSTYHTVGQTTFRFRIVDLVGGHDTLTREVERLIERYPDTAFCLMESTSRKYR